MRDQLNWSLPIAWNIDGARGETPIIPQRYLDYTGAAMILGGRFDIESVTHVLTGWKSRGRILLVASRRVGNAFIHRNERALPRVRLAGKPAYASNVGEAIALIDRLTRVDQLRQHVVVEDPTRPLAVDAIVEGSARISHEIPERMVVETESAAPSYLVVSDSFDPGWSAAVDGREAAIYPAYCAFRAVYLPKGKHTVVFEYSPAGFKLGLSISFVGILLSFGLLFVRRGPAALAEEHLVLNWPARLRTWYFVALVAIVLVSIPGITRTGRITIQARWTNSFHRFTWGAGIAAMRPPPNRPAPVRLDRK